MNNARKEPDGEGELGRKERKASVDYVTPSYDGPSPSYIANGERWGNANEEMLAAFQGARIAPRATLGRSWQSTLSL